MIHPMPLKTLTFKIMFQKYHALLTISSSASSEPLRWPALLTIRSTKQTSVQEDQSRNGYTSLAFMLSDFNKVSKCKLFNFKIMIVNNRCVGHKVVLFN